MQRQRYFYAALLAVLFWAFIKGFVGDPLFAFAFEDLRRALYLALSVAGATAAGIWCADALLPWSTASMSLADWRSNVARITIGFFASLVFAVPYFVLVKHFGVAISIEGAYFRNFMSIIAAVMFALQVVDILIRNYDRRR